MRGGWGGGGGGGGEEWGINNPSVLTKMGFALADIIFYLSKHW
jgi:hypothetical protein